MGVNGVINGLYHWLVFICFKQKTAYEMRISDWSSDVWLPICGIGGFDRVEQTDAVAFAFEAAGAVQCRFDFDVTCNFFVAELAKSHRGDVEQIGRASCRERVGKYA